MQDQSASHSRPLTLLLVEHKEPVMDLISRVAIESGWDVLKSSTGEGALRVFVSHRVDALLTDVDLGGGMPGTTLARAVTMRVQGLPIVFTTAHVGWDLPSDFGSPQLLLRKPFNVAGLHVALQWLRSNCR